MRSLFWRPWYLASLSRHNCATEVHNILKQSMLPSDNHTVMQFTAIHCEGSAAFVSEIARQGSMPYCSTWTAVNRGKPGRATRSSHTILRLHLHYEYFKHAAPRVILPHIPTTIVMHDILGSFQAS